MVYLASFDIAALMMFEYFSCEFQKPGHYTTEKHTLSINHHQKYTDMKYTGKKYTNIKYTGKMTAFLVIH